MRKQDQKKPTVMFHYMREGNEFSTPSVKIAIARKDEGEIKVETITDGVSEMSKLEVLS